MHIISFRFVASHFRWERVHGSTRDVPLPNTVQQITTKPEHPYHQSNFQWSDSTEEHYYPPKRALSSGYWVIRTDWYSTHSLFPTPNLGPPNNTQRLRTVVVVVVEAERESEQPLTWPRKRRRKTARQPAAPSSRRLSFGSLKLTGGVNWWTKAA